MSQEDAGKFFSGLQPISFPLKDIIYEVGTPLEHVYFIEQGVVSILTNMTTGERIEAGMIGSEGIVGLSAVLGREMSGRHVIVQAPLTALRMTSVDFKEAFERSTAVRSVILRYTGTLLEIASQTAACNRLHSLKQRCAAGS